MSNTIEASFCVALQDILDVLRCAADYSGQRLQFELFCLQSCRTAKWVYDLATCLRRLLILIAGAFDVGCGDL